MARPAQRTGAGQAEGPHHRRRFRDRAAGIAHARDGADVGVNYFPMEEPDAKEVIDLITAAATLARLKLHEKFYRSVEPNPDRLIIFALEPWNVCGFDGANLRVPNSCYPAAFRRVVWRRSVILFHRVPSASARPSIAARSFSISARIASCSCSAVSSSVSALDIAACRRARASAAVASSFWRCFSRRSRSRSNAIAALRLSSFADVLTAWTLFPFSYTALCSFAEGRPRTLIVGRPACSLKGYIRADGSLKNDPWASPS